MTTSNGYNHAMMTAWVMTHYNDIYEKRSSINFHSVLHDTKFNINSVFVHEGKFLYL